MSKMQLTKQITKIVVKHIVGYSVAGTVVSLIHNNTTTYTTGQKVQLYIGAAAVGAMTAEAAEEYTGKVIDDVFAIFEKSEPEPDETEQKETTEESPN